MDGPRPSGLGRRLAVGVGVLVFAAAVFIRVAISLNSYSGAGNPPMYGDYEAQRHWMEITYNLPAKEWYVNSSSNDLLYWGLDYPPLTAYHSWLCGAIAHSVNPEWVDLHTSRGHESYEHKLFMRYSVLVADVIVFFSAVAAYGYLLCSSRMQQYSLILLLVQPGLILIDHGHFQYNCVSLGLTLWGIVAVVTQHDILGSIAFTLSLNYKQMELYHALPFFSFLLGKALQSEKPLRKVVLLGLAVVTTFVICWLPFLTSTGLVLQVLRRIFPFARGLFEDKVANFWCSISVVLKLKQLLSQRALMRLSLSATMLTVLPSSWHLLRNPTPAGFILALVNSSLSFFLFSYQVHEKSILLVALPVGLLSSHHPHVATWFSLTTAFSMYPLLVKDGLALACWALSGLFYTCSSVLLPHHRPQCHWAARAMFVVSMATMLLLCALSHLLPPPSHLPHLFPLLISVYSCTHFLAFLVYFHWLQFTAADSGTCQTAGRPIRLEGKSHVE